MLPKCHILRHSLCLALLCPGALAAAAEARVEIIFVSRKRSKERVQRDEIAAVITINKAMMHPVIMPARARVSVALVPDHGDDDILLELAQPER